MYSSTTSTNNQISNTIRANRDEEIGVYPRYLLKALPSKPMQAAKLKQGFSSNESFKAN
jgi:hypothetical protein